MVIQVNHGVRFVTAGLLLVRLVSGRIGDATRNADEMAWLEQQFKRAVPEYAQWLASQESGT